LSDTRHIPGTASESATNRAGKSVEAVSAVWKCEPDEHARRTRALRRAANESAAAIRQRVQFSLDLQLQSGAAAAVLQHRPGIRGDISVGKRYEAAISNDDFGGI